ncbi:hypothetical protein O6H91_23G044500 [Diphasiastrum complanatum]|uniref:Uncharacterized protein n=1 Tax=Diphasiastrum complanatum TaxID=34168 RepID=A0ACC2AAA1_DIPCM|nr:hypothetical protein O6H91_Y299000 [Diphasiastrum complanatum]KAJ7514447.1 hypothetical protein O6H91_23G044500 [Diphasiastrum complanatum]
MEIVKTIPILRIFDVAKAREFYVDYLGFQVDWEHSFTTPSQSPLYMQISRGNCVLHLSEHHGDCCPGSTVYIRATGLDEFHQEITAKDYKYLRPGIEVTPWNTKSVELNDPFGNRLRFNEDVKE